MVYLYCNLPLAISHLRLVYLYCNLPFAISHLQFRAGTLAAKGDRLCQTQRFAERLNGKVGEFRGTLNIFNDEGNPEPSSDVASEKVQRLSRKGVARRLSVEAPTT